MTRRMPLRARSPSPGPAASDGAAPPPGAPLRARESLSAARPSAARPQLVRPLIIRCHDRPGSPYGHRGPAAAARGRHVPSSGAGLVPGGYALHVDRTRPGRRDGPEYGPSSGPGHPAPRRAARSESDDRVTGWDPGPVTRRARPGPGARHCESPYAARRCRGPAARRAADSRPIADPVTGCGPASGGPAPPGPGRRRAA